MSTEPICTVNDYPGLQRAMRARADALQISRATLNDLCGLQEGHVEKLLSDPPKKNMGILSFGALLQALGLKLVVTEDAEMMAAFESERVKRTEHQVRLPGMHSGSVHILITRRFLNKIQRKGGANSRKFVGKRRAKQLARKAAFARWGRS